MIGRIVAILDGHDRVDGLQWIGVTAASAALARSMIRCQYSAVASVPLLSSMMIGQVRGERRAALGQPCFQA